MTYDFNIKIKEIDGTEAQVTLGQILSNFIGTETKGQTIKLFGWMKKLQVADPLELDEADKKTLYDLIDSSDRLVINVKGQMLEVLK